MNTEERLALDAARAAIGVQVLLCVSDTDGYVKVCAGGTCRGRFSNLEAADRFADELAMRAIEAGDAL